MKYLTQIKLLALDVDGVLTDGIIYYSPAGDAMKGFSARDGMGISLARMAGLRTAFDYRTQVSHGRTAGQRPAYRLCHPGCQG